MARKPEYCTNSGVESCNECSMVNYRRDCHNNPIAKDDPNYWRVCRDRQYHEDTP